MQTELDPQVVNLAKAIRQTESGGNFSAQGKSGEKGGYQYTPDTWKSVAPKYGVNPDLSKATPEEQNAVTYNRIKEWKDKGHDVTQIASMWNAGEGEPDAYTGKFSNGKPSVGKNKMGVSFDVPKYVESVAGAYQTFKNGQNATQDVHNPSAVPQDGFVHSANLPSSQGSNQNTQQPSTGGLVNQLQERGNKIGSSFNDLLNQAKGQKGSENWWSDVFHIGGSVAGGIGDLIDASLNTVSGGLLHKAEDYVGGQVSKAADTEVGRNVVHILQNFKEQHPEISEDIGDAFNIVTAIPIFKGLSVLKSVGSSALGKVILKTALNNATRDVEDAIGKTVSKDLVKTMIEKDLLTVGKSTIGQSKGELIWKPNLDRLEQFSRSIPSDKALELANILPKLEGKAYTQGKIYSSLQKKLPVLGGAAGYALGGGMMGGLEGAAGSYLAKKGVDKLYKKGIINAFNPAKRVAPTVGKVSRNLGGLVGGVGAQKVNQPIRN